MEKKFTVGVYPGSFNPFHAGHKDIVLKALQVFDFVVVSKLVNPDKVKNKKDEEKEMKEVESLHVAVRSCDWGEDANRVRFAAGAETLKDFVNQRFYIHGKKLEATGIIRGLRNGHDLQYEMNQQYWNEDVGIELPFVYFITDRKLSHISSSSIRMVDKLGLEHEYTQN